MLHQGKCNQLSYSGMVTALPTVTKLTLHAAPPPKTAGLSQRPNIGLKARPVALRA